MQVCFIPIFSIRFEFNMHDPDQICCILYGSVDKEYSPLKSKISTYDSSGISYTVYDIDQKSRKGSTIG